MCNISLDNEQIGRGMLLILFAAGVKLYTMYRQDELMPLYRSVVMDGFLVEPEETWVLSQREGRERTLNHLYADTKRRKRRRKGEKMAEVKVNPGICGLETKITVTADADTANVVIASQCPDVQKMQQDIQHIDCMEECFSKIEDSQVYQAAGKHCKHVSYPVPSAILKGLEVACGYALPKNVAFTISK